MSPKLLLQTEIAFFIDKYNAIGFFIFKYKMLNLI